MATSLSVSEVSRARPRARARALAEAAPEHAVDLDHAARIARLDGAGIGASAPGRKGSRGHGVLLRRSGICDGGSTVTTPGADGNGPLREKEHNYPRHMRPLAPRHAPLPLPPARIMPQWVRRLDRAAGRRINASRSWHVHDRIYCRLSRAADDGAALVRGRGDALVLGQAPRRDPRWGSVSWRASFRT